MTEAVTNKYQNCPPAVQRLRELCDTAHTIKHRPTLSFARAVLGTNPGQLEAALAVTRAGEIMLQPGETFSIEDTTGYYPDLGAVAGQAEPEAASVTAWIWESPPDGWACQLDAEIWYKGQNRESDYGLTQRISLAATDRSVSPSLTRALSAGAYAETGYEGHGFVQLPDANEADSSAILDIMEPLVKDSIGSIVAYRRAHGL